MSVKRTAPCGHPGEVVIGAYVRCLQGCQKDPFVQPQAQAVRRRGEVGHVDFCACKPCTIRRRARTVVFRTKDGKAGATIPWDGITKTITWTSEVDGTLRHWKLLDEDGDVMVDGMCDVGTRKGDPMRMEIDTVIPVKLSIHNHGRIWKFDTEVVEAWSNALTGLQSKKLIPFKDAPHLADCAPSARQAAKAANFGYKGLSQAAMPQNFGKPNYWRERYKVIAQVHDEVMIEYSEADKQAAVEEAMRGRLRKYGYGY